MRFITCSLSLVLCLFLSTAAFANSGTITIFGPIAQGNLIYGQVNNRTLRPVINGEEIPTFARMFVYGIDRNATEINVNGQKVPVTQKQFIIQEISGLPDEMVTPSAEDQKRIERESQIIEDAVRRDVFTRGRIACPIPPVVNGAVTSPFGAKRILNGIEKSWHKGVDIAAAEGTRVNSMLSGQVVLTGDFFYTGKTVIVDHGFGLRTLYAHLSEITVSQGDRVGLGREVGRAGSTGRSTGPHLHLGMFHNGTRVDPTSSLNSVFCISHTAIPAAMDTLRLSID